ncbi:MAG: hemolysin III family protein [Pontixanthobacter sp.]
MYPSPTSHERLADGIVHLIGVLAALAGCLSLVLFTAAKYDTPLIAACAVYAISMTASFTISASYHLLPHHHWRGALRRMDHAAIYALIAGTFTPLLVLIDTATAYTILIAVWVLAVPAMLYKIFGDTIEPRWSLASYIGLGLVGIFALPDFASALPMAALIAVFAGGFFYCFGTMFYRKAGLPFRYSIWHFFVLLGTVSFFMAIWVSLFEPGLMA